VSDELINNVSSLFSMRAFGVSVMDDTNQEVSKKVTKEPTLISLDATLREGLVKASRAIHSADAIFFTSGAGLGVDSGLPDFRGPQGFWKAYPPLSKLGLQFQEVSNPMWFIKDPTFAWGFWSHRYHLYKNTQPHFGFQIMKNWAQSKNDRYFCFTSNVDGQWEVLNTAAIKVKSLLRL
jgi:NAD-dependent SIR2 family protein deacetylase